MPTHLRNLLLLAALCWVAPASAEQHVSDEACTGRGTSPLASPGENGAGGMQAFDSSRRAFLP